MQDVTVLIPTYRPGKKLNELLRRLSRQTCPPARVLILNTVDGEEDDQVLGAVDTWKDAFGVLSVFHVEKKDFDHGGTRRLGMSFADTPFVLCMTQDALPRDSRLIECLLKPFRDPLVGAAYARQLAGRTAGETERFTRTFNYPPKSAVRSREDLPEFGIKTFFCSDVCAMWRRETCLELGGFEEKTIFNEDMILAGKMIRAGYRIAYCADAAVWHSHNYGALEQLRRNFDLGVSQAQHPEVFSMASSTGEGIRLVKETALHLAKNAHAAQLPKLVLDSACKYAGYRLGRSYKSLPGAVVLRLTSNRAYWE